MAKILPEVPEKVVFDSKTGRSITVRGFGAMKGRLILDPRIDLTKPIAAQVLKLDRKRKPAAIEPKI